MLNIIRRNIWLCIRVWEIFLRNLKFGFGWLVFWFWETWWDSLNCWFSGKAWVSSWKAMGRSWNNGGEGNWMVSRRMKNRRMEWAMKGGTSTKWKEIEWIFNIDLFLRRSFQLQARAFSSFAQAGLKLNRNDKKGVRVRARDGVHRKSIFEIRVTTSLSLPSESSTINRRSSVPPGT